MSLVSRNCHLDHGYVSDNDLMTSLSGTDRDRLEQVMGELRRGAVAIIGDMLVASAETIQADRFASFYARGDAVLVLTGRRASVLKLRAYDGDIARMALPEDRALVAALADPAGDMDNPMKGPFETFRADQEPWDVEVSRLTVRVCKAARLLPAAILAPLRRRENPVGMIHAAECALANALDGQTLRLERFSDAHVPLSLAEDARVFGFRPSDGGPDHFAIMIGDPPRSEPVLVRAHSECYTGDQLGSLKCDCGPQLRAALAQIAAHGAGVLLYLAQEGRGIGMANKLRAYALQDQGFDTVDANHRLGFEDDERDFKVAALMLESLGFGAVEVMTNNPRKTDAFERNGIRVARRVPLAVGRTDQNDAYLATKAARSGHLL